MDSSFVSVSHHDGPKKSMHSPVSHTLAGQCDQRVLTGWTGLGAEPLGLLACGVQEGPVRVLFPWAGQAKGLVPALELFSEPHWKAWPSLLRSVPTANTSGPRASPSGLPGAVLLWHQVCLVGSLHLGLRPRLAVDLLGSQPGRSCIPAGLGKDST